MRIVIEIIHRDSPCQVFHNFITVEMEHSGASYGDDEFIEEIDHLARFVHVDGLQRHFSIVAMCIIGVHPSSNQNSHFVALQQIYQDDGYI
ncbi:hypothetical protein SESBI_06654 [Sesbania bispinosa]|nr:hypothetical protein SESBI_06654 [Sesbania bispinosa]